MLPYVFILQRIREKQNRQKKVRSIDKIKPANCLKCVLTLAWKGRQTGSLEKLFQLSVNTNVSSCALISDCDAHVGELMAQYLSTHTCPVIHPLFLSSFFHSPHTLHQARLYTAFHCIKLHFTLFYCISLHFPAFHCISLHFTALHFFFTLFHFISLHFTAFTAF